MIAMLTCTSCAQSTAPAAVVSEVMTYEQVHDNADDAVFNLRNLKIYKKWITPELYELFLAELAREEKEAKLNPDDKPYFGDGMTFSPLKEFCKANGKIYTQQFSLQETVSSDDGAIVPVSFFYDKACGETEPTVYRFRLLKQESVWLIDDIDYGENGSLRNDLRPKESSRTETEEPVSFDLLADRLNLPRPEDFPVPEQDIFKGTPAPAKIIQQRARTYRSVISDGAAKGPNFAGHYTVVTWGAGMGSFSVAVVDARDGRVLFMPFESIGRAGYGLNFDGEDEMNPAFRVDSKLFAFSGCPGKEYDGCSDWDKLGFYVYKVENERFTLLRFVKQEEFENALK